MSKRKLMLFGRSLLSKKPRQQFVQWNEPRLTPEEAEITDTLSAIEYIRKIFPQKELRDRYPPIIFKHQLYALLPNRTDVDKEVNSLAEKGQIKLFQLEHRNEEFIIILTSDFISYVRRYHNIMKSKNTEKDEQEVKLSYHYQIISRFLMEVVPSISDLSVSEQMLMKQHSFKDKDITELMNSGLLTLRDSGSWWFSIPGAGQFLKIFHKGRQAALKMIRMSKYKEMLLPELKSRKPPSAMKLGMSYHMYDLVGSDLVRCIPSSSGLLLRIIDD